VARQGNSKRLRLLVFAMTYSVVDKRTLSHTKRTS